MNRRTPESLAGRLLHVKRIYHEPDIERFPRARQVLDRYPAAERIEVLPDRVLLYSHDGEATLQRVTDAGLHPITSLVRRSSLEDVFLRLTGRTLVD